MIGPNTISPLLIEDARQAAHTASENQRAVEDRLKSASRELAQKERLYRQRLSERILALRAGSEDQPSLPATVCSDVARGEPEVARLRFERDVAEGILEATKQEAFSRSADRRDLHQLLVWSMRREMATDPTPLGMDRETGELRAVGT